MTRPHGPERNPLPQIGPAYLADSCPRRVVPPVAPLPLRRALHLKGQLKWSSTDRRSHRTREERYHVPMHRISPPRGARQGPDYWSRWGPLNDLYVLAPGVGLDGLGFETPVPGRETQSRRRLHVPSKSGRPGLQDDDWSI